MGRTEAQVAWNWLISKDNVITILKASSVAQALEDWDAAGWRLSPEACRLLETKIRYRSRGWIHATLRYMYRYARQLRARSV